MDALAYRREMVLLLTVILPLFTSLLLGEIHPVRGIMLNSTLTGSPSPSPSLLHTPTVTHTSTSSNSRGVSPSKTISPGRTTSSSRSTTATTSPSTSASWSNSLSGPRTHSATASKEITPPPSSTHELTASETVSASESSDLTETHELTATETFTDSFSPSSENLTLSGSQTLTSSLSTSHSPTMSIYPEPSITVVPGTLSEADLRGDAEARWTFRGDGDASSTVVNLTFALWGDQWDLHAAGAGGGSLSAPAAPTVTERASVRQLLSNFFYANVEITTIAHAPGLPVRVLRRMWRNDATFLGGNETHVTLQFFTDANYEVGQKGPFVAKMTFSARCFRNRLRNIAASFVISPSPRPAPFEASFVEFSQWFSLSLSLANSLLAMSAMHAFQAARLELLWRTHRCHFDPRGEVPRIRHPFRDSLEDQSVAAHLGACGFNTLFAIALFFTHVLFAFFLGKLNRIDFGRPSFALAFFPSLWFILILTYTQWTVEACLVVVAFTDHTKSVAIACACVSMWVLVVFSVPVLTATRSWGSWYIRDPKRMVPKTAAQQLARFFLGRGRWIDDDLRSADNQGFTHMLGALFVGLRPRRVRFLLFDIGLTVSLAVLPLWQPQRVHECIRMGSVAASLQGLYFVLFAIGRPFSAAFDNTLFAIVNALQLTSWLLLVWRLEPVGRIAEAGYATVLACIFFSCVKTVAALAQRIAAVLHRFQTQNETTSAVGATSMTFDGNERVEQGIDMTFLTGDPNQRSKKLLRHPIDHGIFTDEESEAVAAISGATGGMPAIVRDTPWAEESEPLIAELPLEAIHSPPPLAVLLAREQQRLAEDIQKRETVL